jgi:phage terminase Nu1 subunit (DNA packaging protein)
VSAQEDTAKASDYLKEGDTYLDKEFDDGLVQYYAETLNEEDDEELRTDPNHPTHATNPTDPDNPINPYTLTHAQLLATLTISGSPRLLPVFGSS